MSSGVSVVIPNWNGRALLERFLPSVIAAARQYGDESGGPVEIIVVDDGSDDDSAAYVERQATAAHSAGQAVPLLKVVCNPTNVGFGAACNRGFAAAAHPLIFLLNNDVEVERDAIAPLVEHFRDPELFAVHCRLAEQGPKQGKLAGFSRGSLRVHAGYAPRAIAGAAPGPLYSAFASGGSAMFDHEKFLALGGFEPLLFPAYWEDVEIGYRAWKRGYVVLYEPRSVVHHDVSSTMSRVPRATLRRMQQRNRLTFHWIDLHDPRLFASHVLWTLLLALTAPLRLQFDFLRGGLAALRNLGPIRRRRAEEKRLTRRSDRDVLALFKELQRRPHTP